MSSSFTVSSSESVTFTVTHARYLSAKVATDLKRIQRLYGEPTDTQIAEYEAELTEFLKEGYVKEVMYGYRRDDGTYIEPTLRYTGRDLASGSGVDDDPGKIRPGKDVTGAQFTSYLTYSDKWHNLPADKKAAFRNRLPFSRIGMPQPGINGYYADDNVYSSGGKSLQRAAVRSY